MNKKLYRYYLVMALSFVIDSVINYYLPFNFDKSGITIIPYIGLMMFTLLNNTIGDEHRYFFATVTGLYYAIVYANSLLIYVLLYCLYAFLGKKYTKLATFTLLEMYIAVIVTIIAQEIVLYWLVWITNITQLSIVTFMINRLLPTVAANLFLIAPVYFIHKKLGFEGKINAYQSKRD
ncbi:hypothetical protein [Thomasclavelia saccharogumia]|uniref:hypothetical protein n=1 Tax=Thomasclavelia saccharogumia TaxID=341225 RepID=UPI000479891E|nr:hypothetical protein [Thomasclavelia saccharogumia]